MSSARFAFILAIVYILIMGFSGIAALANGTFHIAKGNARSVCDDNGPIIKLDTRADVEKYLDTCRR